MFALSWDLAWPPRLQLSLTLPGLPWALAGPTISLSLGS